MAAKSKKVKEYIPKGLEYTTELRDIEPGVDTSEPGLAGAGDDDTPGLAGLTVHFDPKVPYDPEYLRDMNEGYGGLVSYCCWEGWQITRWWNGSATVNKLGYPICDGQGSITSKKEWAARMQATLDKLG